MQIANVNFSPMRICFCVIILALGCGTGPIFAATEEPIEPEVFLLQWDEAANILATMQAPCEGSDCDAAVNAIAIQVAEQIVADMEAESIEIVRNLDALLAAEDPEDLADWATEISSTVAGTLDLIMSGSDTEVDKEKGYKPGEYLLNGVADSICGPVAWLVRYKRTGANSFRVRVEISGDCACQEVFGTPVAGFIVQKTRYFSISEPAEDPVNRNLYPTPTDRMSCWLKAQCECATEQEEDAPADQDLNPGLGWLMTVNPGKSLAKSRETVCLAGKPCSQQAMPMLREMVDQVINNHNTDLQLRFNQAGREMAYLALMRSAGEIFEDPENHSPFWPYNYKPRMHLTGELPSPCGEAPFQYELTLTLYWFLDEQEDWRSKVQMRTDFFLYGGCECDPEKGADQLQRAQYKFQLWETLDFDVDSQTVLYEEEEKLCDVRAECYCRVQQEEDPVPLDGKEWVISFDSAQHCTYGGGSTSFWLPSSPLGGPIATPVPLPIPPGYRIPRTPEFSPVNGGWFMPSPTSTIPAQAADTTQHGPTQQNEELTISTTTSGQEEEKEPDPQAPEQPDEPTQAPPPAEPVLITVKATNAALEAGATATGAQGMLTLAPEPNGVPGESFAEQDTQSGASEPETSVIIEEGEIQFPVSAALAELLGNATINVDITPHTGNVLRFDGEVAAADVLPAGLLNYVQTTFTIDGETYIATSVPTHLLAGVQALMESTSAVAVEVDICVDPKPLAEPLFSSQGTWSQPYPDQWGVQRVGFTNDDNSAWSHVMVKREPVIIAVIDSGLDWNHLEIPRSSLWQNPGEIAANGLDDDGNGYIDDLIGWDFWDNDRKPWDVDGHGTFVAGILFADADNQIGIAGISRNAKLMVLKAMNAFGHSRASKVAQAILYAVDNGARVINLSLGGPGTSTVVQKAIRYAYDKNVVVVVAAGNEAVAAENQVVSGVPYALTVAATNVRDKRSVYSNYGPGIDIAAPGDDILSLRARRSDLLLNIPGVEYEAETAFVGRDRRYYRASGTSFATPIVSGVAGLLISNNPDLTAEQIMRVIKQSAEDIETPGVDHFTGYGLVDAIAALQADPDYFIGARIDGVEVAVENGKQFVRVLGQADADQLGDVKLMIGPGTDPKAWGTTVPAGQPSQDRALGQIPASAFAGQKQWTIRLLVSHKDGSSREFRFLLNLG